MKKCMVTILFLCLVLNVRIPIKAVERNEDIYKFTMKQDLLCLMMAYPGYITGVQKDERGYVYAVLKSGRKILYDDKQVKSHEQKLANPDLQDMLEQVYPLSYVDKPVDKNFDPGRCRVYSLLLEVYGDSRQKVEKNLTSIRVGGNWYTFNKNNNASDKLKDVMGELIPLSAGNASVRKCIFPSNGTFNYRLIAGTGQLSPHSFGIAIDLARDKRDYWRWATHEDAEKRLASYSREVVEAFERNNFVWGGKWGHFDIMHFEYRPEIILKARYFTGENAQGLNWYRGVAKEDARIKDYIGLIDDGLK